MTKIIGILNYNDNSFSDGGQYNSVDKALYRIEELLNQGASIVDIGAQSTGYGAKQYSDAQEISMLTPLLENIQHKDKISLDTYNFTTAKTAIEMGFSMINDVSGGNDLKMLDLIGNNKHVKYICMFSLRIPADKNYRIQSIDEVFDWTTTAIERCNKSWIDESQLIIDPGLGFSTNTEQSFEIIRNIELLNKFGVKICIGYSRKSFLGSISNSPVADRDIETLATSLYLHDKVEYIRVHNVDLHVRSFKVWKKLNQ